MWDDGGRLLACMCNLLMWFRVIRRKRSKDEFSVQAHKTSLKIRNCLSSTMFSLFSWGKWIDTEQSDCLRWPRGEKWVWVVLPRVFSSALPWSIIMLWELQESTYTLRGRWGESRPTTELHAYLTAKYRGAEDKALQSYTGLQEGDTTRGRFARLY